MKSEVSKYSTSPGAFQSKCDQVWGRRFSRTSHQALLKGGDACLVTYAIADKMPYGTNARVTEQTVLKLVLEPTNSFVDDMRALTTILKTFEPAGFEVTFEDDTFDTLEDEAVLVMWWRRGTRKHTTSVSVSETTEVMKVWPDTKAVAVFSRYSEGRAIFAYELEDDCFLVSDQPLEDIHLKAFKDGA